MRFFRIGIVGLAAVGVTAAAPVVMEASASVPSAPSTLSAALHLRDLYGYLANAALAAPASFAAKPCKGKKCPPPAKKPAPPPPAPPACTPAPAPATTFGKNCPPPGTPNDGMYRPGCQGYGRRDVRARAELADLAMMSADAASAGAKCPPAGTPHDGVYRPGCPGFGLAESAAFALTTASQKARCPAPGTPNDGIYRPGCPGYGRRRDVQDSAVDSAADSAADSEDDSALSDASPDDDSPDSAGNIFLAATSGLAAPSSTDASVSSPADALNLSAPLRSMLSKIADLLDQVTSIQTTGLLGGTNSTSSFPAKQLLSSASSDEESTDADAGSDADADASVVADTDADVADADTDSSTSVVKTTKSSKGASPELPPKAAWSQTTVISTVKQGAAPSDSSDAATSDSDSSSSDSASSDSASSDASDAVSAAAALSQSDRRRSVGASTTSQDRHARDLDGKAAMRSGTAHNEWLSLWAKVQNAHSAPEAAAHARALLRRQLGGDDTTSDAAVASSGDGSADSDSSSSNSSSDAAGSGDGLGLTGDSSSTDTPPAGSIWEAYAAEDPAVFETLGRAFLTAVANIAAQGSVDSSE